MDNPYISRGPVRNPNMFFGRLHELNEIAAFLRGNQSVSIVGPRKIGKTSLLYHLLRPESWEMLGLDEHFLFVFLDCEVLGDLEVNEIFGELANEIDASLEERGFEPEPALEKVMSSPTRLLWERAIRRLNQRGLRVVIILDEFERLSTNKNLDVNFFNALRSAAGRYQLAFITGSAHPLIQLTYSGKSQEILSSPFFNIFAPLFLGLLPKEDACQLIQEPALKARAAFSDDLSADLYELVGGHPLGLQVACFHAFDSPDNANEIERKTKDELNAHFQYYWNNLTPSEKNTLHNLSEAVTQSITDTTLRGLLRDLIQKCLIVQADMGYQYPSRAWESFVNSQQPEPRPAISGKTNIGSGGRIGAYEVLDSIARGGMSEIYKGRHTRLNRDVAIKVLPASLAAEADFRARFEREARAIASLRHNHIVQVFDFGDLEGTYYMVMEFIAGNDLASIMRNMGPFTYQQTAQIMTQVASAIDYAHAQGFVHRDIKPSNVMIDDSADELRAILTDFGIAKIRAGDTGATKTGMMMGTLNYMAPEQIRSSGQVDGRADIYALGVMLFQMLTGQLPFVGENPGAIMMAHLSEKPPIPQELNPEISDRLSALILQALEKEPEDRLSSAGELVQPFL